MVTAGAMRTLDRHYSGVGPTTQILCGFRGAEYCTSPAERFEVEVRGNTVVPSPRCQAHVGYGLGDRLLAYETAHAWVSRAVAEERNRQALTCGRSHEPVDRAELGRRIQTWFTHQFFGMGYLTRSGWAAILEDPAQFDRLVTLVCEMRTLAGPVEVGADDALRTTIADLEQENARLRSALYDRRGIETVVQAAERRAYEILQQVPGSPPHEHSYGMVLGQITQSDGTWHVTKRGCLCGATITE